MIDYYLKFENEAASINIIESLYITHSIDVIGIIYKDDTLIDGWHVNIRGPEAIELNPYIIDVASPIRCWL